MPTPDRAVQPGSGERQSVRLPAAQGPRVVGRYLLCDAFAAGGMATVHLGRLMGPEGFSRTVAIKQLHPQFAHDPKFVSMFLDEARLASRVRHPNVVSPLDVISDPPNLFMVMDYVHGEPLSRLLRRRPNEPVRPRIAAAIVGQVLLGLHAAHGATGERGEPLDLVHRDVSPHNILLACDGVAKVVDFGIAKARARSQKHTERGTLKGKLGYMAPEQINMEAVDRRTDVFAVGVVLWELLTGRRLFGGDTPQSVLEKLMHAPIELPSRLVPGLPPGVDDVVMAALARSPDERFDNARAMAQALDHSLPPASMLEVAAWFESCAGPELSARAELVLDVEGLSFDDFTRAVRHPLIAAAAAPPAEERPAGGSIESAAPAASSAALSAVNGAAKPRRGKGYLLLLLPLLALGCFASFLVWDRVHRPAPHAETGPTVVGLPAPPKTSMAAPVAPPLATQSEPLIERVEPPPPKPSHVAPVKNSVAAPKISPSVRLKDPCEVPYTIDKNGVKRFKEACF